MTPFLVGLAMLGSSGGTNSVVTSLHFDGQNFIVETAQGAIKSPLSQDAAKVDIVEKNGTVFAVWDARGLTVRDGDWSFSTKLEDAALSPRLFTPDEIRATRAMVEVGQRKREAADLAGTVRIGDRVFWLPRWRDSAGKPWLEALFEVNLAEPRPKPRLVGRLQGFAATGNTNALGRFGESVFAITRDGGAWGFAFYTPVTEGFGFLAKGDRLVSAERISEEVTLVAETSPYDTTVVRRFHLPSGQSRTLAEIRGKVEFVNARPPIVDIVAPTGRFLRNLESGAEKRLSPGTPVRWVEGNVLIWSPADRPSSAVLWDPERWRPIAQWTAAKQSG
ncbi:MAG: hypothetical protein KIS66_01495 [Fimbriimonadaceae bacterium]|nr:hypothetical protein [Fimbriimonadaceae bacterium]